MEKRIKKILDTENIIIDTVLKDVTLYLVNEVRNNIISNQIRLLINDKDEVFAIGLLFIPKYHLDELGVIVDEKKNMSLREYLKR